MTAVYAALIHGPVLNKHGEVITTAVTGLNVHDIARSVRTYGGRGYFLVTPLAAQQRLVERILGHWREGFGATYNPTRKEALREVEVVETLDAAVAAIARAEGEAPDVVATSARPAPGIEQVSYGVLKRRIAQGHRPVLVLFGTGWGLPPQVLAGVNVVLPPISGGGAFNHLAVRSAAAIVLDRLLGDRECDVDMDLASD